MQRYQRELDWVSSINNALEERSLRAFLSIPKTLK